MAKSQLCKLISFDLQYQFNYKFKQLYYFKYRKFLILSFQISRFLRQIIKSSIIFIQFVINHQYILQFIYYSYQSNHLLKKNQIINTNQNLMENPKLNDKIYEIVTPVAVNKQQMAFSNKVYLSISSSFPSNKKYLILKGYIFCYELSPEIPKGKIGLNKKFRQFLTLSLIQQIQIRLFQPKNTDAPATSITLHLQFIFSPKQRTLVDDSQIGKFFIQQFTGYFVSTDQPFSININKIPYVITIQKVFGTEDGNSFINKQTKFTCTASVDQKIKLKSSKDVQPSVFSKNFTLQSLGIGGLDAQLTNLFRRAFASRRLPHSFLQKFGIKHIKGILLYGPPGTGKTLIARQLATSLNAKTFTKVDGPQIFGKYVGQSQQNIRKTFKPARDDQKKYGQQSPLHVIVFDQIDAICRQRGSDSSGAASKDAVVNQLLTNLDGVQALNNVIVIGMTNRKDLLDQAILRPGRLQVHIEIGIPDQQGRKQIFQIHTKKLIEQKLLDKDVSLSKLASLTQNYTGAEIQAVVRNASSYAMNKGNDMMDFSKNFTLKKDTTVNMNDFLKAINQIPPSFGLDQQNFQVFIRNPIINYGKNFQLILQSLQKCSKLALNNSRQLVTLLMYGQQGAGKTSIASHFAKQSKFNFVKLISPQKYVGMGPLGKISIMDKVFRDAYKSSSSLIIIDNIERIVEYVQTGPDFNNNLMQTLLTLLSRIPPNPECKLLVIGTTSSLTTMQLLGVEKSFGLKLKVPNLNKDECRQILGADIGIQNVPIKKLVHFKSICEEKPKSSWKKSWLDFSQ